MQNNLYTYCLRIADNNLILSHKLSEYCSKGPYLEEDLALSNVALDLLGHAEMMYEYACELSPTNMKVDDLVFKRLEHDFYNVHLVEQPNTDYAYIMARQFYFDAFNKLFFEELIKSSDNKLAALGSKALKEVTYHLRRSSEWIIRLGDGTEESNRRVQDALDSLFWYSGELFEMDNVEHELINAGIGVDSKSLQEKWTKYVSEILNVATLKMPEAEYWSSGGRIGNHTEHLGFLLSVMQFLPRTYPEETW